MDKVVSLILVGGQIVDKPLRHKGNLKEASALHSKALGVSQDRGGNRFQSWQASTAPPGQEKNPTLN